MHFAIYRNTKFHYLWSVCRISNYDGMHKHRYIMSTINHRWLLKAFVSSQVPGDHIKWGSDEVSNGLVYALWNWPCVPWHAGGFDCSHGVSHWRYGISHCLTGCRLLAATLYYCFSPPRAAGDRERSWTNCSANALQANCIR